MTNRTRSSAHKNGAPATHREPAARDVSEAAPLSSVALDEGVGPAGAPGARGVEMHIGAVLSPAFDDVFGPDPGLLDLVGSGEQGPVAEHRIQQQALVGVAEVCVTTKRRAV